ncbi:WD40 repeat domain-containing protein [Candidatus Dependentiae bacterium]|nr:WD40 repeat domain-containing protein [Candidatus Dependentiae bacterium]
MNDLRHTIVFVSVICIVLGALPLKGMDCTKASIASVNDCALSREIVIKQELQDFIFYKVSASKNSEQTPGMVEIERVLPDLCEKVLFLMYLKVLPSDIQHLIARLVLGNTISDAIKPFKIFRGRSDYVTLVVLSPDGLTLLVVINDNTPTLWNVVTEEEDGFLAGHTNRVVSAAFSPDGTKVLTGSFDQTVRMWNVKSCQELFVLKPFKDERRGTVFALTFSPDGKTFLSAYQGGVVYLCDTHTGATLLQLNYEGSVRSVAFNPNGESFLTGTLDDIACLWDIKKGQNLRQLKHSDSIDLQIQDFTNSVVFIKRFDKEEECSLKKQLGYKEISSVAFNSTGTIACTASGEGTTRLWDIETGSELLCLQNYRGLISFVQFTHDDRTLFTYSPSNLMYVWDKETGQKLLEINNFVENCIHSIDCRPQSSRIVVGSGEGKIGIGDLPSYDVLRWVLYDVNFSESWFIVKISQANKIKECCIIRENSFEHNVWKKMPKYIQKYLMQVFVVIVPDDQTLQLF